MNSSTRIVSGALDSSETLDEVGVDVPLLEVGVTENGLEEGDRRVNALHDELLERDGPYREFVTMQWQLGEDGAEDAG